MPTPGNENAGFLHQQNRFSITRQLRYSNWNQNLSLYVALFVNGLPIIAMELKYNLAGQTYKHAIEQYKNDRSPTSEPLLRLSLLSDYVHINCSAKMSGAIAKGMCPLR